MVSMRIVRAFLRVVLLACFSGVCPQRTSAATLEVLTSRPAVTEKFALLEPSGAPVASVILFSGADGKLNLTPENLEAPRTNFLVRVRHLFADKGFQVAILDSPSDHPMLEGFRVTRDHATDIAAVIAFLRERASVPVWLIGTSRGSISAANAAARLAGSANSPDGIVLTSTVTTSARLNPTTVFDVPLRNVNVPVLIIHHRNDGCEFATYRGAKRLAGAFPNSSHVELLDFDGGRPKESADCEPLAPHGYYGIEARVVDAIASWTVGGVAGQNAR
jgi:hypothetical protein